MMFLRQAKIAVLAFALLTFTVPFINCAGDNIGKVAAGISSSQSSSGTSLNVPTPVAAPAIQSLTSTSSRVSWVLTGGAPTSLTLNGNNVLGSSFLDVSPSQTTTYTLVATNSAGFVSSSTTITIATPTPSPSPSPSASPSPSVSPSPSPSPVTPKPEITSLTSNPSVITVGSSTTISWTLTGLPLTSLKLNGVVVAGGQSTVTPATTTVYNLVAVNAGGSDTKSITITVNPAPTPTPSPSASPSPSSSPSSTGVVTAAMWAEIASQRSAFGDPNDCKARVDAIPSTGSVLAPGGDIGAELAKSNVNVVVLQTGTYTPTGRLLAIPTGKMLIAGPGQKPVVDLSQLTYFAHVYVGDNTTVAGIEFKNASGISIVTMDTGLGRYSNGGLLYNLKVHDSGAAGTQTDGTGISLYGNEGKPNTEGQNWCVVAVEVYDSWNKYADDQGSLSPPKAYGGNSDGLSSHFGAGQNTFIAINSHNNADDGVDMWHGGATYHYFSTYHDNGTDLRSGLTNGGDGNGVKLGSGTAVHKFYKVSASNNKEGGFNLNANTQYPLFVQCSGSGNHDGNCMNPTPGDQGTPMWCFP